MSGVIKINGQEIEIFAENNSSDVALSSFSGYLGFNGEMATQYGGTSGKVVSLILSISGGTVTAVFDKKMNPQKEYDNLIGTALLGYASGEIGAAIGGFIASRVAGLIAGAAAGSAAGPVGAIVGAVLGAVAGGLWGDDIYNNGEKLVKVLADNLEEELEFIKDTIEPAFEFMNTTIYGKVTQQEFILHGQRDVREIFPDYVNYRQITEIKSGSESFLYNQLTQHAKVQTASTTEAQAVQTILQNTQVQTINLNNKNLKVADLSNLELRNAIDGIDKVSFLLSNILIKVGEQIDLGAKGVYTVKSGDTLSMIAQNLNDGTVTKDLVKLNPWLFDDNRIQFNYPDKVLIAEGTVISDIVNEPILVKNSNHTCQDGLWHVAVNSRNFSIKREVA